MNETEEETLIGDNGDRHILLSIFCSVLFVRHRLYKKIVKRFRLH